jgi:hypothetical protein
MFKKILVVGMMLLSGVASAQQAVDKTQVEVKLNCYSIDAMARAVVSLNYKPLLTAQSIKGNGSFSSWIGPNGELLVVASSSGLACVVLEGIDVEFVVNTPKGDTL